MPQLNWPTSPDEHRMRRTRKYIFGGVLLPPRRRSSLGRRANFLHFENHISLSLSLGFSSVFSAAVANCLRAIFFIFLSCVRSCYFRYDLTALRFVQYTAHIVFADKPYPNYEIIAYCSKLHFSGLDVFAIVAIIKYRLKHTLTVCCCRYAPCVCTCMGRTVKSIT